ncbi:MAG: sigma-70 family RNA polymerase sigma factor [Acidimicrobiales bacterium]
MTADFSAFYDREAPRLVRSLSLAIGQPALAEEAVAEAFARAWSRWPQVRAYERPVGWVARVALNESRSHFRRQRLERRTAHALARADVVPGPEPPASYLWQAVARLPTRERTLIALRYVADLPQAEIGEVLGLPAGTVASGLHRARMRLGEALGSHEEELT